MLPVYPFQIGMPRQSYN